MKKVTLQLILQTPYFEHILYLKKKLIYYKQLGVVFYREDMSSLQPEEPFEFYYVSSASSTAECYNAFPVPIEYYHDFRLFQRSMENLIPFYQVYYSTDHVPEYDFLTYLQIHEAKNYAWFYQSH